MTKKEFIEKLTASFENATEIYDSVMEIITESLKNEEEVVLHGIGKLKPSFSKARKGRNPQTGEEMDISAKKGVKFTASKKIKDVLNG